MALREVLFGAQKQAARQVEVIEEFVKNYINNVRKSPVDFTNDAACQQAIGMELYNAVQDILYPSSRPEDGNYVSPEEWFFVRLFLGVDAVNDICANPDCGWDVESTTQANGKVVYYAYMCENEEGEPVEGDDPVNVDTTEADKIVEKVISYCPPSEREKLPADDKLAAVLLSQSYWRGRL